MKLTPERIEAINKAVNEAVEDRYRAIKAHLKRTGMIDTRAQEEAVSRACMNRAERRKYLGERSHRPPPTMAPSIKKRPR